MNTSSENSSKVLESLGKALWSVFLPEADQVIFRIKMFDGLSGERTISFFRSGKLIPNSLENPQISSAYLHDTLAPISKQLQHTPPFDRQPFTHMRFELTDQAKMNVDFAYIPEWDSWPGLFMRGVSELSEEEAKNPALSGTWGIDYDIWKERRAQREREPYQK